ncbi:hypothetical protein DXN05_11215 [Deminuibacter soli]|uniref:Uncharacterized protein n=1 Tax=Deminuibacter soli TaxID=2291815 RepID=A0A3E1NJH8_9BACT|nr:hypothetical protein DXN05_11215 [Deminuibacter soli]
MISTPAFLREYNEVKAGFIYNLVIINGRNCARAQLSRHFTIYVRNSSTVDAHLWIKAPKKQAV